MTTLLQVYKCSLCGNIVEVIHAGEGELVMVAQGPSARNTRVSDRRSIDAVVCGIVDLVEERGAVVYRK